MSKEKAQEKEFNTVSFYSEEDGNLYPLPFIANEGQDDDELELPDGSTVWYENGWLVLLATGPRMFSYEYDFDRMLMLEYEMLEDEIIYLVRTISLAFFNSWNRFSCNQNTYITDLGEEVHFCINNPEPVYKGKLISIVSPDEEIYCYKD